MLQTEKDDFKLWYHNYFWDSLETEMSTNAKNTFLDQSS